MAGEGRHGLGVAGVSRLAVARDSADHAPNIDFSNTVALQVRAGKAFRIIDRDVGRCAKCGGCGRPAVAAVAVGPIPRNDVDTPYQRLFAKSRALTRRPRIRPCSRERQLPGEAEVRVRCSEPLHQHHQHGPSAFTQLGAWRRREAGEGSPQVEKLGRNARGQ